MKTHIIIILTCTLIIASYSSAVKTNNFPPQSLDDLDDQILELMKNAKIPSFTACIIKNQSIIWSNSYGLADIKNCRETNVDTVYFIASVTKTVIATALMQLYDQGLFDLDDDVNNYLTFNLRNPNHPDIPITFRMLLAHQSSITDGKLAIKKLIPAALFDFISIPERPYPWIKEALTPNGSEYDPNAWGNYPPGEKSSYSNIGYIVLGTLIEKISGQTYEDYCQQHIFDPLRMNSTSFEPKDFNNNNTAVGYCGLGPIINLGQNPIYIKIRSFKRGCYGPMGGLYSTVEDIAKILIVHMNNGFYGDIRILNESTINEMHRIQYPESCGNMKFGLGWYEEEWYGSFYNGHWGKGGGCSTVISNPVNNTGVVFFYNLWRFRYITSEEEAKNQIYNILIENFS